MTDEQPEVPVEKQVHSTSICHKCGTTGVGVWTKCARCMSTDVSVSTVLHHPSGGMVRGHIADQQNFTGVATDPPVTR